MWLECIDCKRKFENENRKRVSKRKKPELIGDTMFRADRYWLRCYLHWLANGHDTKVSVRHMLD